MDVDDGVATEALTDALAEIGNNWERQPLRADEGRFGWEEAMVGCIKDVSRIQFSFLNFLVDHAMHLAASNRHFISNVTWSIDEAPFRARNTRDFCSGFRLPWVVDECRCFSPDAATL
jgi:hypothetical protein